MAFITMDIDGRAERLYGYVIPGLEFDLILGKGWAERNDVVYKAGKRLQIGRGNSRVKLPSPTSTKLSPSSARRKRNRPLNNSSKTAESHKRSKIDIWDHAINLEKDDDGRLDPRQQFTRQRACPLQRPLPFAADPRDPPQPRHCPMVHRLTSAPLFTDFESDTATNGKPPFAHGAPATFQRYINSHLHDLLDEFCSAYMDDVIIYSDGDYLDHMTKVRTVMERLRNAGLKLDLEKCAFAVKEVKYLGFIIKAGEGVTVDPEKIQAIRDWEAPTTVTGVRSFLGFKLTKWNWDASAQNAFNKLKELLITSPVLAMFHPTARLLRPVGYFSRKFSAAEVNYDIHDKELLAIVAAMEHFSGELRSVDKFIVVSDHKNLQYFMTNRRLSERQVRLAETLSRYTFKIVFRAGKDNTQPDFLSRRAQDLPANGDDERLKNREFQLLKDHWLPPRTVKHHQGDYILNQLVSALLWDRGLIEDGEYRNIHASVVQGNATFPSEYNLSVQVPDCEIDDRGALLRRGALWTHDSHITGHPGRDVTLNILQRSYFWPQQYLMCHYRFHGFPKTMTSDRGSNWVSKFWQRLCELVRIEQRLSTAYHPQTDGATERMNQEVLVYLRIFVAYAQTDWAGLLPMAMLAINNRDSSVTGYSPFFLTHGYHAEPIQQNQISSRSKTDPKARADHFIARLREGQELAQAAKATAQQIMEHQANKGRRPSQKFVVGEKSGS
ncbi:reverse transcriptase (RNA-dependent DNA polymerase) domain-containing protein [Hirsutella rhossiliensis]|uniref:Reverse transcriptase (RNA-dependent DNA polymerase) domain-containing protein n=1 Tax=Hirsutella rhossiliensis TaxID=111463 RepID=A0A9P8MNA6_9HYPO|nr:reverse transcriptase (RNA-dependent DNA polymerase) domain-containing protein [Hirsutella rhossiliensis]KAH0957539.1 reverse transcriptase (RNA-dependent DNA polymerase) domain-containing protein [Hirsutella rhossiliensis]